MSTHVRVFGLLMLSMNLVVALPAIDRSNRDGAAVWRFDQAVAQPAPGVAEKDAFESAKALGTLEAWDAFLTSFPSGFYADLARAYVKKLSTPGDGAPSAPQSSPQQTAAFAHELPCSDVERLKLKSFQSTDPVKLKFVNDSGAVRVIQWIDFNGGLKEYAELKPGEEMVQETFLTHPWIAAYQEGSCSQLFMPGQGLSLARLTAEAGAKGKSAAVDEERGDHGPTPEQTCRDIGQDYNGVSCVPKAKKSSGPSKKTIEGRAKAACVEIGMIYLDGKCAPKYKTQRDFAKTNKNKACPKGMYRNPYGQCQPNETGG